MNEKSCKQNIHPNARIIFCTSRMGVDNIILFNVCVAEQGICLVTNYFLFMNAEWLVMLKSS
jgi:hypothetical protein